jgi:hypothetical protein
MVLPAPMEPNREESARAQVGMAQALLDAMATTDVVDLRPGARTVEGLLEALVVARLRLAPDPQGIADEALGNATA